MQEIKIILLPPANAQRVQSNHSPSSFFPLAQLRKSKCSSECPHPSLRQGRAAPLWPYLCSSVSPPRAGTWARQRTSSCSLQRCSHGSVPPLPPHLCRALRGAASSKLMYDCCEIESSFRQWQMEWEGKGFGREDGKDWARGGTDPFRYFQCGAVLLSRPDE